MVVSLLVFMCILFLAAETVFIGSAKDRDEDIRDVRSSTDTHYLQERAVTLIQCGETTGSMSMFLCRLALGALFVSVTCSGITLVQTRRLRKQIDDTQKAG
jgi:hypothetical protein